MVGCSNADSPSIEPTASQSAAESQVSEINAESTTSAEPLEVSMEVSVSGKIGNPIFEIQTNLPDGTILELEVDGQGENYIYTPPTQDLNVKDGKAISQPLTGGEEYLDGTWWFYITMLPSNQPEKVLKVIGENGENLTGTPVKDDGYSKSILIGGDFDPAKNEILEDEQEQADEADVATVEEVLEEMKGSLAAFGEDCSITMDGYLITVNIWQDGLAQVAYNATLGDRASAESWDSVKETIQKSSDGLQAMLDQNGYGNYMVQLNLLNDKDTSRILITAVWGTVTYDCVSE